MKSKTLIILVSAFLVLTIMLIPLVSASVTVPTTTYLGLPTYGTYINFSEQKTFSTIYREDNYWYFDSYRFRVQNANMTITDFFTTTYPPATTMTTLSFILNAASGNSTAKIYIASLGTPKSVSNATAWTYDATTKLLTIQATHNSPVYVTVIWRFTSESPAPTAPPPSEEMPPPVGVEPFYTITIRVTNIGTPFHGALVTLGTSQTTTDVQGTAVFLVGAGTYPLSVSVNGKIRYTSQLTVTHDATYHVDLAQPTQPPTEEIGPLPTPPPSLWQVLGEYWLWITIAVGLTILVTIAVWRRK